VEVKNCIAVVTGGASGLGEATVRNLVSAGARVAIFDLQSDRGEALVKEIGDAVIFVNTDVTSSENVQEAIEKTTKTFGGINVAINCAGFGGSRKVLSKEGPMPLDFFNMRIQVNLVGTFNVIRLAIEKMVNNTSGEDGEKGVIINTASTAAFEGQIGQAAYAASKGGIVAMTLPVARECAGYGIRVVTIAPGLFETPMLARVPEKAKDALGKMVPFPKRLGEPSEYAYLVQHIIENMMINGEVIRIDGSLRMPAK
jgi:3-hydroxyacyl-CoA dehydrogenase / 3-hydroxy-2-methylbutyryl-CoA dehydrogenase